MTVMFACGQGVSSAPHRERKFYFTPKWCKIFVSVFVVNNTLCQQKECKQVGVKNKKGYVGMGS